MVKTNKKAKTGSLLTKINLRTIIHSKLQFIAVILITAIAMTLFVGLTSNAKSIQDRVDQLYEGSNLADIWTTTTIAEPGDKHQIETLVGPKGETEGRFVMPCKIRNYDAMALMSEELPTINKPYETDSSELDDFFIVDKRLVDQNTNRSYFKNEDGSYTTAPVQFSVSSYLKMFDTTIIGTYDGQEKTLMDAVKLCMKPDAPRQDLLTNPYLKMDIQVTGEMMFAENVQSSQMNKTNFLLSVNLFRKNMVDILFSNFEEPQDVMLGDPDYELKTFIKDSHFMAMGLMMIDQLSQDNQYVSKVDPSYDVVEAKENIQAYFDSKEKSNLLMCTDLEMLPSNFTIQSDIVQASQLAYIFPIIFFLVAILVVLTTISQIIIKDRIQIGTMKALGMSNAQVMLHYIALSVYIVLIGVVIGTIIGPFIIPQIMNQKYDILYTLPGMGYTLAYLEAIISALIAIGVTALVSWLVVRNTAKLKPAESMRPKEVKAIKSKTSNVKVTRHNIPIRMALRNIKVNITKSLMVIIGIAGCTALLVCGFGIDDTLHKGVDTDVGNFFTSDLSVSYNMNSSIKDDLLSVEGVSDVEEFSHLPATASKGDIIYNTMVFAFDDNSKFFNFEGYELKGDIAISNKVANSMHLKIGDTISFSTIGMNFEGKVGFILDCFYMHGIYLNSSMHNYNEIGELKTGALANIKDSANLDSVIAGLSDVNGVSLVKSRQENIDMIEGYMSSIQLMTLAVKVFAILLAIVVLYNLSLLNFKERSRDIATLKVLGFSRPEISASLFLESIFLTLIGVGFGLLLGLPMEILVLVVNLTPIVEFLYTVAPISYVISFLLTIGTTCLVNYALTFKIKGVKMVESLKSVE